MSGIINLEQIEIVLVSSFMLILLPRFYCSPDHLLSFLWLIMIVFSSAVRLVH